MTPLLQPLVGLLLACVGVLALTLSVTRGRRVDLMLAAFGAFALLYGVRILFGGSFAVELGLTGISARWVSATVTYLIQIPAWIFFWQLLGHGWGKAMLWLVRAVCAFAVIGVVSDLAQGTPGTLTGAPNNIVAILGVTVVTVTLLRHREPATPEIKVLGIGLAVLGAFVVNENLVGMGLLPWSWRQESIGMVFFVACLGFIAVRRFITNERQLTALEGELAMARDIQRSLLPERPPAVDGLAIAVRFRPTSAVAGDYYDFVETDGALGLLVADVSGHGVPAALIGSMVKVAARSHLACADRPAAFLGRINETLCGVLPRGFVTAVYARFDSARSELAIANAGHPAALLRRSAADHAIEVGGQGPILGRFPSARYADETVAFDPGDRLVLYTDGLIEARDPRQEPYGEERFRDFAATHADLPADAFCHRTLRALAAWAGEPGALALDDDLTLLVVDRLAPAAVAGTVGRAARTEPGSATGSAR